MYKDTGTHIKFMQFVKKKISLVFTQSLFVHILDTFKVSMNILLSKPKQMDYRSHWFKHIHIHEQRKPRSHHCKVREFYSTSVISWPFRPFSVETVITLFTYTIPEVFIKMGVRNASSSFCKKEQS